MVGDFNVVRSVEECFGSTPLALPSQEFGDMISDCALMDLPFVGSSYTWYSSSSLPPWKRLDRIMLNSEKSNCFSISTLEYLSKHLPITLLSYLLSVTLWSVDRLGLNFRVCG